MPDLLILRKRMARLPMLVLVGLLTACHPEQYRWASTPTWVPSDGTIATMPRGESVPTASIASYAISPQAAQPDSASGSAASSGLERLSDHGQQAFIERLAATSKDPASALQALIAKKKSSDAKDAGSDVVEENEFQRTLVVTVSKAIEARPGDRLMKVVVELTPIVIDSPLSKRLQFVFAGYTVPATSIQAQSIATVHNTMTTSLTGKLSPTLSGAVKGGAEGDLSTQYASEGTTDLSAQYEAQNLAITPEKITLVRESERGIDLSGNVTISPITISLPENALLQSGFLISNPAGYFKNNTAIPSAKLSISITEVQDPPLTALCANVVLSYQLRTPSDETRKYYLEGNQNVTITSGKVDMGPQVLVRPEEFPKRYHLVAPNGNTIGAIVNQKSNELIFASYSDAEDFNNWFAENPNERKLGKQGYDITATRGVKYSILPVATPQQGKSGSSTSTSTAYDCVSSQHSTTASSP